MWKSTRRTSATKLRMPKLRLSKLQTSCDACVAGKVKCSEERPQCELCTATNRSCSYSARRKHGRPLYIKDLTLPGNDNALTSDSRMPDIDDPAISQDELSLYQAIDSNRSLIDCHARSTPFEASRPWVDTPTHNFPFIPPLGLNASLPDPNPSLSDPNERASDLNTSILSPIPSIPSMPYQYRSLPDMRALHLEDWQLLPNTSDLNNVTYVSPSSIHGSPLVQSTRSTPRSHMRPMEFIEADNPHKTGSQLTKNEGEDETYPDESSEKDDGSSACNSFGSSSDWCIGAECRSSCEYEHELSYDTTPAQSGSPECGAQRYIQLWLLSFIDRYVSHVTEWLDSRGAGFMQYGGNHEVSKPPEVGQFEPPDNTNTAKSLTQRRRKHVRDSDEAPSEDDEDQRRRPRKGGDNKLRPPETSLRRLFACFFHKRQPWKFRKTAVEACYKSCPGGYPTVHRLWSDHCRRLHKAPIHCLRCKRLFDTQEELEVHLYKEEPACKVNNEKVVDGINESHKRACAEQVKYCKTEKEKWETIYRILFPGEEVPDPYTGPCQASSPIAEEMTRFAEHFKTTDLPRLLERLPSSDSLLDRSELYPLVKSTVEDFMNKYNGKLLQHLQESKASVLATDLDSAGDEKQEQIQDQDLSLKGDAHLHTDSKINTLELTVSPSTTQRFQGIEPKDRGASSIIEPTFVITQGHESTIQATCRPTMIEDSIGTQENPYLLHDMPTSQTYGQDSLDPQNLVLNPGGFQVSNPSFPFEGLISRHFPSDFRPLNQDVYSAWMQGTQPDISGLHEPHQQAHYSNVSMEDQYFPESQLYDTSALGYGPR